MAIRTTQVVVEVPVRSTLGVKATQVVVEVVVSPLPPSGIGQGSVIWFGG